MKNISKIFVLGVVITLVIIGACTEPFDQDPVPASGASTYSANFIFGNASDAASLDFYVNNLKTETTALGIGQTAYFNTSIASNGVTGAAGSNTNLRAKATTGTIGGTLGSSDIIFRSANNGSGNFTALDSAYYTVIALDTISRPAPLRKLNAGNFGDVTFFNPIDSTQYSVVDTVGKSAAFKAQLITIGIVPLGSSDPGGPRFLVITDQLPLPSATRLPKPATGKAAVRFVNGLGDGTSVAVTFGVVAVGGSNTFPLLQTQFNPSVGSRSLASLAFSTVNSGATDITVKYSGNTIAQTLAFDLADGGVYTFFVTGSRKFGTAVIGFVKNK